MRTGTPIARIVSSNPLKIVPFPVVNAEESRELSADDVKRCEDLCKDLSSCIDVLYELSRSRRAIQEGTYPFANAATVPAAAAPEKTTLPPPISKALFSDRSFSSSGETLVTPSRVSTEKTIAVHEPPPKLEKRNLVLPQEPPPAYGSHGSHAVRMIGHLKHSSSATVHYTSAGQKEEVQPVLVEYAFFDPTYRETGVRLPPTEKLDALMNYFAKSSNLQEMSGHGTLACAGWFEDLDYSRYGIVYDLPRALRNAGDSGRPRDLRPASLVSILQSASRSGASSVQPRLATGAIPPLEDRFKLAHSILRAVSRMHEDADVMHRNICSNNILFFTKGASKASDAEVSAVEQYELAEPYVVGFDLFTDYNIASEDEPHQQQHLNIYQHPDAFRRSKPYRAEFDAYSLGLLLLEIGLWIPLSDLWKAKYTLTDFRSRIEGIWVKKLAAKVGSAYMNVVKDLLAAASSKKSTSTNTPETKSRLKHAYSRSLLRLRRCCMIDEAEPLETPTSDSMQDSTLDAMVHQGTMMDRYQAISSWTEKTQLHEELSGLKLTPAINPNLTSNDPGTRSRETGPQKSTAEHQYPHTLPVSIEEASEDALSRRDSSASNTRKGASPRWSFGLGSPRQKDISGDPLQHAVSSTYHTAAQTIQRAWRSRREAPSFQEYKRKVTIIQQFWRRRRNSKQNSSATPSETAASSFYTSTEHLSNQHNEHRSTTDSTTIRITPQAPRRKLRIQPKKLPPTQVREWHADLLPRLERILAHALKESPETCSIDLLCVGDTPASAKPTIFVTCSSTSRVKAALSRRFAYDCNMYDLKVRRGTIRRSKSHSAGRRVREAHRSMAVPTASTRDDGSIAPLNPFHQKRPICGASIGAYADAQHLPPVSFGGVISVDSGNGPELYGMTVHHLLDSPSDDEDADDGTRSESGYFGESDDAQTSPGATRSSAAGGGSWLAGLGSAPGLDLQQSELQHDVLEISDDSSVASDGDVPELDYSSEEDEDESVVASHASTEGDLVGVAPEDAMCNPVYVTQPAIDDIANDFFPDIDDRDDDHLSSHKLGVVYASSGIRRWQRGGIAHEVDWALLKLDANRLQPMNVVQGGRKYLRRPSRGSPLLDEGASHKPEDSGIDIRSPNPFLEAISAHRDTLRPKLIEPVSRSPSFSAADDEYPTAIVPADNLGSLRVHCFGRTSGLKEGVIGDTMSSVRIYRRRSFSRSWHVLGGFGMGGDSGAWILDNESGRVCGHVLAFAERNSMAYICPLEIMFEDILRALDAKSIGLPGGEEAVVRSDLQRRGTVETNASAGAQRDEDELPFDINELGIDDADSDERPGGVVLRASPIRPAARSSHTSRAHDRERLMYAPGGVLSVSRSEAMVGGEREPPQLFA